MTNIDQGSSWQLLPSFSMKIRNPKLEIRNKPKNSNPKSKASLFEILCYLIIRICFEFRNSGFEFFLATERVCYSLDHAGPVIRPSLAKQAHRRIPRRGLTL